MENKTNNSVRVHTMPQTNDNTLDSVVVLPSTLFSVDIVSESWMKSRRIDLICNHVMCITTTTGPLQVLSAKRWEIVATVAVEMALLAQNVNKAVIFVSFVNLILRRSKF